MRIAIDARVRDGEPGGVQQTMQGVAHGLASLDHDHDDEYHFLVWPDHDWLVPSLVGACRALVVPEPRRSRVEDSALARRKPALARSVAHVIEGRGRLLPRADPVIKAAGIQLVHFMQQRGFRTRLPSIYQPHDLQHVHHPEFFNFLQRAYRHRTYRAMAEQSARVSVMTDAAREDVVTHLGVRPEAVIVVPWASMLSVENVGRTLPPPPADLPARFLLYPAQSWPHKNHLGLVRALADLRMRHGLDVPVVCTGRRTEHFAEVMALARGLGVEDLLHSLGFVSQELLITLYQEAVALVFPSLYEGWGLPLVEAFAVGTPVLCSDISPLREVAADAAQRFDPRSPEDMAAVIASVWEDPEAQERLRAAGRSRAGLFTWSRSAALFRAHYRDVLGVPLADTDRALLASQPVV